MTPQRDEADRFLRCLMPCTVEFRHDDEAFHLISADAAGRLLGSQLAWVEDEIANHWVSG